MAQQGQKSQKGNPASTRMSNANHKLRCEKSHRRSLTVKQSRRAAEERAHARNLKLKEQGQPLPWERALADRKTRRAHDPAVIAKRKRHAQAVQEQLVGGRS